MGLKNAAAAAAAAPTARFSESECYLQYNASLKCLEKNSKNKSKCEKQLDIYKECKRREREARLARSKAGSLLS